VPFVLLGSGSDFKVSFQYALQEEAGGIAQALSLAEDFADGDDVTVILGGNVMFGASSYVRSFSGGAMAFFKRVRNPRRFVVPAFEGKSWWPSRRSRLTPRVATRRSAFTCTTPRFTIR